MTEKLKNSLKNGVSAQFGYYPIRCDLKTEIFSIQTLPDHDETVSLITEDKNITSDWLYSGPQKRLDIVSRKTQLMPYSGRIFGLSKTHSITLHKSQSLDELEFVVWCLSFFTGMRLTTTERGFLDATPIKPKKLIDFNLRNCDITEAVHLAINFLEQQHNDLRAPKRIAAAIHTLFLAQYPQSLPFEQFQYLYMALDTCFKLFEVKEKTKPHIPHAQRIQWMCEKLDIPTPTWAVIQAGKSPLSEARNNTIHEALFFDEPLGFSIYGGNEPSLSSSNVIFQMRALICRLLVALLGQPDTAYVKSPVTTRMTQHLEIKACTPKPR